MRLASLLLAFTGTVLAACGGGGGAPADLREAAHAVAEALEARDLERLAELVHPEEGVRFSPYAYVEPEEHVTLTREHLRGAAAGETLQRTWGHFDGSGEPIELSFREYLDRFVYDAPYLAAGRVTVDERQGRGNTVDNAAQVYPDPRIVEYHLPGRDPRYEGMDWRSLRLVFEEEDGRWYLVGVVHDEWTI
jgi:predicted small secreted protein